MARFQLADSVNVYHRVLYTALEFIGDVGGIAQVVSFIGQSVVGIVAVRLYFASLIRDTFRVRLDAGGTNIRDLIASKTRANGMSNIRVKPW